MSIWRTTRIKTEVLIIALMLATSLVACSDKTEAPVSQIVDKSVDILQGLMECRNQFSASSQTIKTSKDSVSAEQRLEQLMNALTVRQTCEDSAFKK